MVMNYTYQPLHDINKTKEGWKIILSKKKGTITLRKLTVCFSRNIFSEKWGTFLARTKWIEEVGNPEHSMKLNLVEAAITTEQGAIWFSND